MRILSITMIVVSSVSLQSCATVFSGYYTNVELTNAPDTLLVSTRDGVDVPVERTTARVRSWQNNNLYENRQIVRISLRSNLDPVLILTHDGQERRIQAFGKIRAGWLILDVLFGGLPCIVDGLTGNWNSYDPIDASFK